jgi:hypothetical protein
VLGVVLRRVRQSPTTSPHRRCCCSARRCCSRRRCSPWYGLPLAALATVAVRPVWLVVPAAAYPAFFAIIDDGPTDWAAQVGSASFAVALVVLLAVLVQRTRHARRPGGPAARPSRRASRASSAERPR